MQRSKSCFAAIQKLILLKVYDIQQSWPILFTQFGLATHYEQLVGKSLDLFINSVRANAAKFLAFMQSLQLRDERK